jgi:hypothetical protein
MRKRILNGDPYQNPKSPYMAKQCHCVVQALFVNCSMEKKRTPKLPTKDESIGLIFVVNCLMTFLI